MNINEQLSQSFPPRQQVAKIGSSHCPKCLHSYKPSSPIPKPPKDRPVTNELLSDLKDAVFQYHLSKADAGSDFTRLDEESLLRSEIATHKILAHKILKSAHHVGMIDPETGRPDTSKITRNMVNDMPVVGGISKQRELVMLLFFWEEEVRRWDVLEGEEREIEARLGDCGQGESVGLDEALKVARARKRVLQSRRDESGNVVGAGREELPGYSAGE